MGYYRNNGLRFAWDLRAHYNDFCYAYQNSIILRAKKFFLKSREFRLKGAIEEYVGCFLVYLFQEVFILLFFAIKA